MPFGCGENVMKTVIFAVILLSAVPVRAADAGVESPPPSPPPVAYDVWGFRWDGRQYVKQATHSLSTADLQQAADYAAQITSFAGWSATTNLPEACVVHKVFHGPAISSMRPTAIPEKPRYAV